LAEASVLANYVDGVIFVVRAGKTPRQLIRSSIESLGREKILGIVFNGSNQDQKKYKKYYKNYYK
jgi:Mrp family chromosome partitioning ATPase